MTQQTQRTSIFSEGGKLLVKVNLFDPDVPPDLHDKQLRSALMANMPLAGANLRGADLRFADLRGANLRGADLTGANLAEAKLSRANLYMAKLRNADCSGADFSDVMATSVMAERADFRAAIFCGARISSAFLTSADLSSADLSSADCTYLMASSADLTGAKLTNARFRSASLQHAVLRNCDLTTCVLQDARLGGAVFDDTTTLPDPDLPPVGMAIIGYKKLLDRVICTLRVPPEAQRTASLVGKKCRAEWVEVLEGGGVSIHDMRTVYIPGEIVRPHAYVDDSRVECAPGIHFFRTKAEAESY